MTTYDPNVRTIFGDLETTGLHRERREIWEIGLVVREPGQPDVEYEWQILPDMSTAEEVGLRIGQFYKRNTLVAPGSYHKEGTVARLAHPLHPDSFNEVGVFPGDPGPRRRLAAELAPMFDGAQLVGFCPWFDEHSLWRFFRDYGQAMTCDYHLVDVESVAAGYAHAAARWAPESWIDGSPGRKDALERVKAGPGWTSADLSLVTGVVPPEDRHRALVDARWSRNVLDVITGYEPPTAA